MGKRKLFAPAHLIAVACTNEAEEEETASILIRNNVNFKRSNNDIELLSINAKEQYYAMKGENAHETLMQ